MAKRKIEVQVGASWLSLQQLKILESIFADLDLKILDFVREIINLYISPGDKEIEDEEIEHLMQAMKIVPAGGDAGAGSDIEPTDIRKLLSALQQPAKETPKTITIKELKDKWLRSKSKKKSIKADRSRFPRILEYFGEDTPIDKLDAEQIEDFRDWLVDHENEKPVSEATANRFLALLRAAFNFAKKRKHHHNDPFDGVALFPEKGGRVRTCSKKEYEKLTAGSEGQLRLGIVLGYNTGMRLSEIANLEPNHLHLDETKPYILLEPQDTKSGKPRVIPLMAVVVKELKKGELIKWRADTLTKKFSQLCKDLEIGGLRFHDLRRSFITNCRRNNVDLITTMAISGHSTIEVVKKHYSIVNTDDLHNAIAKLE